MIVILWQNLNEYEWGVRNEGDNTLIHVFTYYVQHIEINEHDLTV